MRKKSGFTTYELMVTIAIMAVIAAITMPPYLKWYRGSRLRSAVSSFMVDLEMAKTEAIRENTFVDIPKYYLNWMGARIMPRSLISSDDAPRDEIEKKLKK